MHASCTFDVSADPSEVLAYLSEPRHLLVVNNRGQVVDRSDHEPTRAGSWSVLALDQLRVRVEYTAYDPPHRIATSITYTGRGSRSQRDTVTYTLVPTPEGGTTITLDGESTGGWMPASVGRLLWPVIWRRIRHRIETRAGKPSDRSGA
jgi:uncharacterized protein YndB with AHSA1/START domain